MASRLSSLLVRDGLIGVKRMERAFQRQVIYGGALDTILLEMSLIDEASLCDYLSLATGLPPATQDQMIISSDATDLCDEQMALQYNVAPLAVDGDALRVLVCEPVDFAQLEDLADALDMAIQPLVAPEFRFHLLLSRAYAHSGDARFMKLAETVADIEPARRPPTEPFLDELVEPRAGADEPEPVADEPEPVADEPEPVADEPEPVADEPEPVADEPEPVADEPEPVADEPEPVADEPEPVADEPEPEPVADEPEPVADESVETLEAANSIPTPVEDAETAPVVPPLAADVPDDNPDREIVDVPLPASQSVRATMRMSTDAVAARLNASLEARRISDAYRIVRPARSGETGVPTPSDDQLTPREIPLPPERGKRPPTEPIEIEAEPATADRGSERFSASFNSRSDMDSHGVISGEIEEFVPVAKGDAETQPYQRPEPLPLPLPLENPEPVEWKEPAARERARTSSAPPTGAALTSLSVKDAEELLERADDRDLIFSLLLRGLSRVASYAGLLAVQGGSAMGRMALDNGNVDVRTISSVLIPLGVPSPFQQVVKSMSPYIGRLASEVEEVDEQARLMGGVLAPTAVLLPVVLRTRVVAIAIGHCGEKPIEVTEVAEVFRLAEAAANALLRLIRKAKSAAAQQLSELDPAPEAGPAEPTDAASSDAAEASAPAPRPRTPSGPVRDEEIEELLDELETGDTWFASEARRGLLGRAAEVVPLLDDRFPGKLIVDRYEVGWRTIRAGQYGKLMDLVVQLGAPCGPMLASKLRDPRRDIRYYAAVCIAELRPQAALEALVEALFDRDYGVRDIAIHALGGYPVRELKDALGLARRALDSDDSERVMAAANALAVLGDLEAIPALLDVVEMGRDLTEPARRALRRLTAQDFGSNARKWRSWWDKNSQRPRVEWLLDSLGHKDDELRRRAVDDLRTVTGESFGFQADANKRDRETARRQWLEWWESDGRRRFASQARDERSRETAKLPRGL